MAVESKIFNRRIGCSDEPPIVTLTSKPYALASSSKCWAASLNCSSQELVASFSVSTSVSTELKLISRRFSRVHWPRQNVQAQIHLEVF